MAASFVLRFVDQRELECEYAQNFAHGRAFVTGVGEAELFTPCALVLEHPESGATLQVDAEVVMVLDQGATQGIALQFRNRSDEELQRIAAFVAARDADNENAQGNELPFAPDGEAQTSPALSLAGDDDVTLEDLTALDEQGGATQPRLTAVQDRQLRLRNLNLNEQLRIARGSNMQERIQLERIHGSAVWETLLRNSKITVPEVARIAKKGTIPRPLVDLIVDNEAWLHQSIVRRALLSNPRVSPENALKILRTLPHRELKLVPHQNGYPATVRAVAARLLKGG